VAYLKRGKLWLSVQPYMVKNSFSRQNILKLDARHRSVLTFLWRQYGTPLNNYLSPVPAARASSTVLTNQTYRQDFCDICDVIHRPEGVSAKSQQKYFIVGISTLVSRNIGRHLLKRQVYLQFFLEKTLANVIVPSRYYHLQIFT
jgi:hypothetical protein